MKSVSSKFSMTITSDPQYPWYDGILPSGLETEDQIKANSERQIRELYGSINTLQEERKKGSSPFQIEGVLINGDLTAYGHGWQFDKYAELLGTLKPKYYPGLGNHDYLNNVDDTYNNNAASRMVNFMYDWLKVNTSTLNDDFGERSYYLFPELRTDYFGSLSYSFNLGKVHFVQLQNFPSYVEDWNSWNGGSARRDFYFITGAFRWLKNDLAIARNRGDVIIVSLHDYHDNFIEPGVSEFNGIMKDYSVSAVFAGHIHSSCGQVGVIGGSSIPFFRSGAASYQDYLVADIDIDAQQMKISKMACPENGSYAPTGDEWTVTLNDSLPEPPLPVPPTQGYVTFFNEGGFEAKFELQDTQLNGERIIENSGTMRLGNKKTFDIPSDATEICINAKENTGLVWEGWRTVFDLRFDEPPNKCYKLQHDVSSEMEQRL